MESNGATALRGVVAALRTAPDGVVVDSDEELIDELLLIEEAGRLIDGRRVRAAAEAADRSRRELGQDGLAARLGHGRPVALLESLARIRTSEAKRRIRVGSALAGRRALDGSPLPERFPTLAAAVEQGAVGLDAADIVVAALESVQNRADPQDLAAAEEHLTHEARTTSPELLQVQVRAWIEALDPDGTLPREERQRSLRFFRLGRERADGMTPGSFLAPPEQAAALRAAFDASRPRLDPLECGRPGDDRLHPVLVDPTIDRRTREQEDFDLVFTMLTAGAAHEVVVHVSAADLEAGRGAGWITSARFPISMPSVERIMCDGTVRLVVTGNGGEPLFLSRAQRRFSKKQKKAIEARDGGCAWPGCTARAAWTDVHHVAGWVSDHGASDVDNGVLLCPFHHHFLHASNAWEIEMVEHVPYLRRRGRHGEITPRRRMQRHPIQHLREGRDLRDDHVGGPPTRQ